MRYSVLSQLGKVAPREADEGERSEARSETQMMALASDHTQRASSRAIQEICFFSGTG
jgi:hypothetical protein